jgi:hypothetical protein
VPAQPYLALAMITVVAQQAMVQNREEAAALAGVVM